MKAVLLVSHGSRLSETKREVEKLTERLRLRKVIDIVGFAFLEIETPSTPEGIDLCVSQGAQEIIILLNFLNSGRHVDVDIPAIVEAAHKKYPGVVITVTKPIGHHPKIEELFLDLLK